MRSKSTNLIFYMVVVLFFCITVVDASAQQKFSEANSSVKPASAELAARPETSSTETERIRALEDTLRQQNEKIDQMLKLIQRQQQMIDSLDSRTSRDQSKNPGAADVSTGAASSLEKSAAGVASPPAELAGKATSTDAQPATAQNQQPTIEDRLKAVEERVTKIGPIRFGGDFRLRFDGTFRPATDPPDPALQHVQNARMRYRLRLNLDTDLNKLVSFHGQLATGPINNGLTLDQDFTATVARHPFFISEAWVDVHPNKNLQLQGGRVVEVFADNSRFLFDDDVRFNGFNERFIKPFSKGGNTNIELRAG